MENRYKKQLSIYKLMFYSVNFLSINSALNEEFMPRSPFKAPLLYSYLSV